MLEGEQILHRGLLGGEEATGKTDNDRAVVVRVRVLSYCYLAGSHWNSDLRGLLGRSGLCLGVARSSLLGGLAGGLLDRTLVLGGLGVGDFDVDELFGGRLRSSSLLGRLGLRSGLLILGGLGVRRDSNSLLGRLGLRSGLLILGGGLGVRRDDSLLSRFGGRLDCDGRACDDGLATGLAGGLAGGLG